MPGLRGFGGASACDPINSTQRELAGRIRVLRAHVIGRDSAYLDNGAVGVERKGVDEQGGGAWGQAGGHDDVELI